MKNRLEYYSMYWNKYSPLPGINDIIINIRVDTSRDTPIKSIIHTGHYHYHLWDYYS